MLRARGVLLDASVKRELDEIHRATDHHTPASWERSVKLRPDEIASILKSEIERYEVDVDIEEVGTVIQIGDGIARIYGLDGVRRAREAGARPTASPGSR